MKKNVYTQTISKITVPDELLNSVVENIRNTNDVTDKVININKPKSKGKIFKLTGSVAAVLAVIIAFGAVYLPGTKGEASFVLKANAAELNRETYVWVGDLGINSIGAEFTINDNIIEISGMDGQFNLDIQCIGDNIETVTYTTDFDCGYFVVDTGDVGFIKYSAPENPKSYGFSGTGAYPITAKSCIFDYEHQPASRATEPIPDDGIDGTVPLCVLFHVEDTKNKYAVNIKDYGGLNHDYDIAGDDYKVVNSYLNSVLADYLNTDAENFKIDITATFTDGTTETQTLQFNCEDDGNNIYLTAKIV